MAKSKKKSVKPLGAFVLVKRNEAESTTQGGIIIPDSSQEKPLEATVVSVGACLLYTSPSPRDKRQSRMPSSA